MKCEQRHKVHKVNKYARTVLEGNLKHIASTFANKMTLSKRNYTAKGGYTSWQELEYT